jgi:antitoxin (DNA-binding transcriptional repressor) of toxin-antitoxin stability system
MYHMRKASVRDLRYDFKKIEHLLHQGQEVEITKRQKVIARLIPQASVPPPQLPDFMARLHSIYGDQTLKVSGAEVVAKDRERY